MRCNYLMGLWQVDYIVFIAQAEDDKIAKRVNWFGYLSQGLLKPHQQTDALLYLLISYRKNNFLQKFVLVIKHHVVGSLAVLCYKMPTPTSPWKFQKSKAVRSWWLGMKLPPKKKRGGITDRFIEPKLLLQGFTVPCDSGFGKDGKSQKIVAFPFVPQNQDWWCESNSSRSLKVAGIVYHEEKGFDLFLSGSGTNVIYTLYVRKSDGVEHVRCQEPGCS